MIYSDGRGREFHFLKVFTINGEQYLVLTNLQAGVCCFYMKRENGKWVIVEPEKLTSALREMEEQFNKEIEKHRV